jgi:hypothetical protein
MGQKSTTVLSCQPLPDSPNRARMRERDTLVTPR